MKLNGLLTNTANLIGLSNGNSGEMNTRIGNSARRLLAECSENRSPAQIAWGLAIGASLGVVPMDNLTSAGLLVAVLCVPVNQLAAFCACLSVACVMPFVSFMPNALGGLLLSFSGLTRLISLLYQLPGTPWLRLENTQVTGGLTLGMCSVVPNYFCCKAIVLELQRRLEEMTLMTVVQNIGEIRKTPWESDGEFAPSAESEPDVATCMPLPASIVSETRAASTVNQAQSFQSTSQRSPLDSLAYGRNVRFDAATSEATSSGEFTNSAITNSVIANNDSVANSSSASQSNTSRSQLLRVKKELQQSISYVDSNPHATETVLRETLIEVVRYRSNEPKKPIAEPQPSRSSAPLPHEAKTMIVESKSSNLVLSSSSNATSESDNRSVLSAEPHNVPGRPQPPVGTKGSGSLRHLLRHITHSRDGRVESESGK